MHSELRPFWAQLFKFNWKFGLFLILLVCIPRFLLVLGANADGNYGAIGLVFINNQWSFYAIPTVIWVASMFLVSILFFTFRKKSDSILGAIICHAAFNFGMIYCIFYLLENNV